MIEKLGRRHFYQQRCYESSRSHIYIEELFDLFLVFVLSLPFAYRRSLVDLDFATELVLRLCCLLMG
jgi:hypothetical protein